MNQQDTVQTTRIYDFVKIKEKNDNVTLYINQGKYQGVEFYFSNMNIADQYNQDGSSNLLFDIIVESCPQHLKADLMDTDTLPNDFVEVATEVMNDIITKTAEMYNEFEEVKDVQ